MRVFGITAICLGVFLIASACGGGGGTDSSRSGELSSSEAKFEVEFRGAKQTDKEVRLPPALEVTAPPSGTSWYGFELYIKNAGEASARTPDVGVVCGSQSDSTAEFFDDPGFVVGEPPYVRGKGAGGELDAGASNIGVVPLPVPEDASECRFLVRMDEAISGASEPLVFSFEASR